MNLDRPIRPRPVLTMSWEQYIRRYWEVSEYKPIAHSLAYRILEDLEVTSG